ncbi:hypothetical protein KAT92_06315 [Candidatus Babeliales bacterium]|nr:hypothetical protein [Candidatus Babeliales bacterium]
MFDIPDKRLEEIKDIVGKAARESGDPDSTIDRLTTELLETEEFGVAMFYLGQMASVDRKDIVVNAIMMMLGGMSIVDGMSVLTSVIIHTINSVGDHKVKVGIIDATKRTLDSMASHDPVDPDLN